MTAPIVVPRLMSATATLAIVALAFVGSGADRARETTSGAPETARIALGLVRQEVGSAASGYRDSGSPAGSDVPSVPGEGVAAEVGAAARKRKTPAPTVAPTIPPTLIPTTSPRASLVATPPPTVAPTPTAAPTAPPTVAPPSGSAPTLAGCPVFPADNVWNKPVSSLPVRTDSATLVGSIGSTAKLHPDFGSYAGYGIPYNVVNASTPRSSVAFDYADESDQVPYPIPSSPAIEAGSDSHILMLEASECHLYELWNSRPTDTGWAAGSGATWDLRSNALRPEGWTSADAAGLPILPGLVRYDEVAAGAIHHAIRFTAPQTRRAYIYPARHYASSLTSSSLPPMGLRVRLKASYDISGLPSQARVIAQAMQTYGMILADNGSSWFFQGASDPRFDDTQLNVLKNILGSAFEAVDTAGFVNGS